MNENQTPNNNASRQPENPPYETMFCSVCGAKIAKTAIACPHCGAAVAQNQSQPQIVINNANTNSNANANTNSNAATAVAANYAGRRGRVCNKWVAFVLCLALGFFGGHCFYEGKVGKGILYIFTGGLFLVGWFIDLIAILSKPNPYVV